MWCGTQAASPGTEFMQLQRKLIDGHWVLAFPDTDRVQSALQLTEQHTAKLRAYYCQVGG